LCANRSAHNQNLVKSQEVLESVQQLSTSHSEALRIISHTEEITAKTQRALHELADRFVHREAAASLHDEHSATKIINALDTSLRQQLADHFARLSIAGTENTKTRFSNEGSSSFLAPVPLGNQNLRSNGFQLPIILAKPKRLASSVEGVQKISEPLLLDYSDLDNEMGEKRPSQVETTSKYQSPLGVVVMRTGSSTYQSLLEIMEAELEGGFPTEWEETKLFPVTITTAEILLLPQNWKRDQLTSVRLRNWHFPSNERSEISVTNGFRSNYHRKKAPNTARHHKRSTGSSISTTKHSSNGIRTPPSSPIIQSAFRTALKHVNSESFQPNPASHALERNYHRLRNSFDHEINDAIELVYLWLHSGFNTKVFEDPSPVEELTISQSQILSPGYRPQRLIFIEQLRLQYTNKLVAEMVLRSSIESNRDWYRNLNLDSVHGDYWDRIMRVVMSDPQSVDVEINPIIAFLEWHDAVLPEDLPEDSEEGQGVLVFIYLNSFCFLKFAVEFVETLLYTYNRSTYSLQLRHEMFALQKSLEPVLHRLCSIANESLQETTLNPHGNCLDCSISSEVQDGIPRVSVEDCVNILRTSPSSIREETRQRRELRRLG
jgi:hypothetical protein